MKELRERIFTNIGFAHEHISMLKYFDALNHDFYKLLFSVFLENDEEFSNEEVQRILFETLTTPYVFRIWNEELQRTHGICDHSNNGIEFKFKIDDSKITYIKVGIEGEIFERKYIR